MPAPAVSPIVAALDHPEVTLDPHTTPIAALSLVEAFGQIPDPRHARGIRHGVLAIVLLGACAVLTGARSFAAIGEYAHDTGRAILDRLGAGTVVPHASTIRRVLQDLDPDAVEAAMRTWALAQLADRPAPAGVPVRRAAPGTRAGRQDRARRPHPLQPPRPPPVAAMRRLGRLSAAASGVGARPGHRHRSSGRSRSQAKSSEIAAFTTLLDELDLTDVLVTADAVHTNRHSCRLPAPTRRPLPPHSEAQPTHVAAPAARAAVEADRRRRAEHGRGHGRVETRSISVVSLHPCPDLGGEFFPHAAQAIKVVRRRRALGSRKWTTVTVYAITSLTARASRPGAAGSLAAWALGDRGIALGPRCVLRRGPLPGPHPAMGRRSWPRYATL